MPGGRRGDPGYCRKRRRRGMRLILRPSLLLMLAEKENHGYELYDQLSAFGFEPQQLDSSIVYRDLREMEELGLIKSYWDDDSKGPKRRTYRILDAGQTRLEEWIVSLESIRDRINQLIKRYESN